MASRARQRSSVFSVLLALGACILPTIRVAQAQDAAGIANIFGGLLGAAMVEQNRAAWRQLPPNDRSCVAAGLQHQGASLQQVIAAGIPPNDGRISSIRSTCASISGRSLKQNVECTINTPTGVFTSRCDEDFTSSSGGEHIRLDRADALKSAFSDQPISTALFERSDAIARRQQMMTNGLTSGNVAVPNFDCSKATSPTAIEICQSNTLAALDAEYGALYQRVFDGRRQAPVARQATKFLDERQACAGAEECIRQNLVSSVEFMARVLRKRGEDVTTSVEQAKKDAQAEAAKQALEEREAADAQRREAARVADEQRQVAEAAQREAERVASEQRAVAEAAKQEADRQAQLRAAVSDTKALIDQASDFLKFNPQNANMLSIAEAIASANAALIANDPTRIEDAENTLSHAVRDDPAFPKYLTTRAEQKSRENARLLADAIKLAQQQRRFLASYIAQNPTSVAAASEIARLKKIEAVLANPDLKQLQKVSNDVEGDLRKFDLQDNFLLSLNAVDDKAHSSSGNEAVADLGTTTTDKNRFLLDGKSGDLVLMYVAGPSAPHVVKNLRGDIVFDQHAANACIYQRQDLDGLRDRITAALGKFSVTQLLIDAQPCNPETLLNEDVIAVERGTYLRQQRAYAAPLLKEIETDHVRPLLDITETQAEASLQSTDLKRKRLQEDIEHGALDGFALILLPAIQEGPICGAIGNDVDAHEALLAKFTDPTVARLRQHLALQLKNADDVFTAVQRSRCAAIYASAGDLKVLLEALTREKIAFQLFPEPVFNSQIVAENKQLADDKAVAERKALARQRQADEARALQSQRQMDEAATKPARQAALRAKYGKAANAYAAQIADDVKAYVTAAGAIKAGKLGSDVPDEYPSLASWYDEKLKDHWELQSVDSDLDDFGTAEWKSRAVEGAVATIKIRMKNRLLGEYQDGCYAVGELIDHEFSVSRDPVDVPCGDKDALQSWKQGHAFASLWNVH